MSVMTPEDKAFARECLERRWLTIEQLERIKEEAGRRNVSFREAASARGVPPPKSPPGLPALLIIILGVSTVGSLVAYGVYARDLRGRLADYEKAATRSHRDTAPRRTHPTTIMSMAAWKMTRLRRSASPGPKG